MWETESHSPQDYFPLQSTHYISPSLSYRQNCKISVIRLLINWLLDNQKGGFFYVAWKKSKCERTYRGGCTAESDCSLWELSANVGWQPSKSWTSVLHLQGNKFYQKPDEFGRSPKHRWDTSLSKHFHFKPARCWESNQLSHFWTLNPSNWKKFFFPLLQLLSLCNYCNKCSYKFKATSDDLQLWELYIPF